MLTPSSAHRWQVERKWNEVKENHWQQWSATTRSCRFRKPLAGIIARYLSGSAALRPGTQERVHCPQKTPAARWRWCRPFRVPPSPACQRTPLSPDHPTLRNASSPSCESTSQIKGWTSKCNIHYHKKKDAPLTWWQRLDFSQRRTPSASCPLIWQHVARRWPADPDLLPGPSGPCMTQSAKL